MFLKKFGGSGCGRILPDSFHRPLPGGQRTAAQPDGGTWLRLHAEGSGHHYLHPLLLSNPCRIPHHAKLPAEWRSGGGEAGVPAGAGIHRGIHRICVVIEPAAPPQLHRVSVAQITILAPKEKRGIKGIILFAVIAVVVCVAVYFIFRFGLNVMLPAGILG